jgi:hypothetical protein
VIAHSKKSGTVLEWARAIFSTDAQRPWAPSRRSGLLGDLDGARIYSVGESAPGGTSVKDWARQRLVRHRGVAQRMALVGTIAVLAVVIAPAVAAGTAAVSTPDCSSAFDAYSASPATLQACGIRSFPLIAKVGLPDGGTSYQYSVDGDKTWINIPPSGFDALKADAAKLALYGVPDDPGPADAVGHADWTTMAAHLSFKVPPPALEMSPLAFTTVQSDNWSGQIGLGSSYNSVQVSYNEPVLQSGCTGGMLGVWGGLGGTHGAFLAQNGTAQTAGFGLNADQAWYEFVPGNGPVGVQLYATPGSTFEAFTTHNASNSSYTFFWWNSATDDSYSIQVAKGAFSNSTAELIIERPKLANGTLPPLAKYGTVHGKITANNVNIGPNNEKSDMYNGSHLLSQTGDLDFFDREKFDETWKACS